MKYIEGKTFERAEDMAEKKFTKKREKGLGYFGRLKGLDGKWFTEYSVGVREDWTGNEEMEIPSLVPTLTDAEIQHILSRKELTPEIMDKAREHARMRIESGLDPFAQPGEQRLRKPIFWE